MPVTIKSAREIELMAEAGRILEIVHNELRDALHAGMSTLDIDRLGEEIIRDFGCVPNFKNYNGFPASICVSINDEVVHGKGSMIEKMPGEYEDKFANLRTAYGFMYGHPGKKLLFMGQEFAQFREWSEKRSLDWELLDYDMHQKMQAYVRELNKLYEKYDAKHLTEYTAELSRYINPEDLLENRDFLYQIKQSTTSIGYDIT